MDVKGSKKIILYVGVFFFALIVGMLVMNGIGIGVRASSDTSDFQMNGTKLITYTGTGKAIDIPSTVTEIGDQAFADNTSIESVTMPLTLTTIGYRAFSGCTALKKVDIPDSVTKVGPGAFYDCTSLSDVTIGEKVSSWGSGVFAGCTSLTTCNIDSDNQYLVTDAGALYSGDQSMLYQVFAGRVGDNYVCPGSVKSMDTYAFWNCQNLKNVSISGSVKEIPAYSMTNMNSVENVVIPNAVTTISEKAFADNAALKQVSIPVSVTSIHETAFDNCPNLKILTTTSTTAEQYAKAHNIPIISEAELDTEFLDSQVSQLDQNGANQSNQNSTSDRTDSSDTDTNTDTSGNDQSNQQTNTTQDNSNQNNSSSNNNTSTWLSQSPLDTPESADVKGKTIIVNGQAVVLMNNTQAAVYDSGQIQQNGNAASDTQNADQAADQSADDSQNHNSDTSATDGIDPSTQIAERAYYKKADLTDYTIADDITSIGKLAFARTGLKKAEIPSSVGYIGYGAFYDCKDLSDVTIPGTVQVIEAKAFDKTAWMDTFLNGTSNGEEDDFLIVGDGILLAYRGTNAEVTIPGKVKQIGAEAFKNHTELTTVQVPESVTGIGANAFAGCSKLEGLTGCKGLKTIVAGAFKDTLVTDETYLKK